MTLLLAVFFFRNDRCQSPFGELYGMEVSYVPTAALLRSLQWVS